MIFFKVKKTLSCGVSLKRALKCSSEELTVDLRSIGHSSPKLWFIVDFHDFGLYLGMKMGPVGIEKTIFGQKVQLKSCLYWSMLSEKHHPKSRYQKKLFMKQPNGHLIWAQCALEKTRARPRISQLG